MKLSVSIPTHSMKDSGFFFRRCLDSLWNQSFQDFEIVVTDNSDDNVIKEICEWYRTGIKYYRNPIKGMAQNTNEAIKQSKGELIKILYMDDFLFRDDSLGKIVKKFSDNVNWLVTGCVHVNDLDEIRNYHKPKYNAMIYRGINTIGSPSVLTVRNKNPIFFDENLTWLLDCCYYKRLYELYGEPMIINLPLIAVGVGKHQMTNLLSDEIKNRELIYLQSKYLT